MYGVNGIYVWRPRNLESELRTLSPASMVSPESGARRTGITSGVGTGCIRAHACVLGREVAFLIALRRRRGISFEPKTVYNGLIARWVPARSVTLREGVRNANCYGVPNTSQPNRLRQSGMPSSSQSFIAFNRVESFCFLASSISSRACSSGIYNLSI